PSLKWPRSAMGLRRSAVAAASFREQHHIPFGPSLRHNCFRDALELRNWARQTERLQAMFQPGNHLDQSVDPHMDQAVLWLDMALRHSDDKTGELTAVLALMYGACKNYDKMIECVESAVESRSGESRSGIQAFFHHPAQLLMLVLACHTDLASI